MRFLLKVSYQIFRKINFFFLERREKYVRENFRCVYIHHIILEILSACYYTVRITHG